MKKINVICVGKIKEQYYKDAIAEYCKRLQRFCQLSFIELPDCSDSSISIASESAMILQKLPSGYNILMDIGGKLLTSVELSSTIETAYIKSPVVNIIIGGSNGVDNTVRSIAKELVSFGRITYPHQLMRLVVVEQIYRCMTITSGISYHK